MNCKYRQERNYIANKIPKIVSELENLGYTQKEIKAIELNKDEYDIMSGTEDLVYELQKWCSLIKHKREKAKQSKLKLLDILKHKVEQNEISNGKDHIRTLRKEELNDTNVVSVFDSALSRTIGIDQDELSEDLIVLQIYYFDVFKDMCFFGFKYNGEKYRYFTSSAGQIRKKKAVFIKESVWDKIEKTLMCGLTIDSINAKGGTNVNKYLAYMALNSSATDKWDDFDIDKCIVVDDFETNVNGLVDHIDPETYAITRKEESVPIPHTDGVGIMLPRVSTKNFMVRMPWIKGLLGVFDFRRFVKANNCSPVIKDIYGKEWDIFKDDIQIILTKSQFKLWKFYDSWQEYKDNFKKYNCSAGMCNVEEDRIKNAKINYQMLQTLTDVTPEEVEKLTYKSATKIENICNSKDTMMEVLGITPYNTSLTPFQKSVKLYSALLSDTYAKDVLREVKNSLLKKYRSGKLEVFGKYTFILPDLYAFCEWLFLGKEVPDGLLEDQEVYCNLFRKSKKLDCLRSPHLYKEHAVRHNIAAQYENDRRIKCDEWFVTNAIYTSTKDLLSRILQFDVDGDKSLVVADEDFVEIAERNIKDVVPLYYEMKKAKPAILNNKTIYEGLNAAFVGGNIGIYSNNISKIWNSEVFVGGTQEEKENALYCIKCLCCQNNFTIDYAKTLYKPEFPEDVAQKVSEFTKRKLPAFFEYAKDKEKSQVEEKNLSFVNRIFYQIPDRPINTRGLNLGKIDYKIMMNNPNIKCSKEVSDLYDELNKQYRFMINMKDEYADNLRYVACKLRSMFADTGHTDDMIADMLVQYLYGENKRYKQLLWFCYGQKIVNNIESNVLYVQDKPTEKIIVENTKIIQCIDCGEWIEVKSRDTKTCRCDDCKTKYKKSLKCKQNKRCYVKNRNSVATKLRP